MNCSKCNHDLGEFVPKERLDSQKAAFVEAEKAYKAKITELEPKATRSDELAAELATVKGQFESFTARATRTEALRASGLDPSLLPSLEALHGASQAAAEDGSEVAFDAWLQADDGAKAHPLLRHMFQGAPPAPPAAPGAPVPPPTPAVPPARKPPADTGRTPAGQPKMSPEQLQGYYQSAEYKSKNPEERRAIREQHKREFLTVE